MAEGAQPHPSAGTLASLQPAPIIAPALGSLAEVNDGILHAVLGQPGSPRRDHALDLIPPWPQRTFVQPLAHVEASLELTHRPVVGETGVASMLTEQSLLLHSRLQCNAMGLLHERSSADA